MYQNADSDGHNVVNPFGIQSISSVTVLKLTPALCGINPSTLEGIRAKLYQDAGSGGHDVVNPSSDYSQVDPPALKYKFSHFRVDRREIVTGCR